MAQQTINVGTAPNDGTGTPLRTAFQYTNSNFSELYTAVGPSGNNIVVPGSATITGDLTVDTSTLKVDSANNRVGIGTASPAAALVVNLPEVSSAAGTSAIISNTTGGGNRIAALRLQNLTNQWNIRAYGSVTDDLRFGSGAAGSEVDYLSIGNTGIFTWSNVGGVAGTAMTLNSTGLGVGVASPTSKLTIGTGSYSAAASGTTGMYTTASGLEMLSDSYFFGSRTGGVLMTLTAAGNLGIGVVPTNKFQVRTTSDGVCQFIGRGGGTNNPNFQVSFADATTTTTINAGSGAGNPILTLATGGGDRLIIDASGNVIVNSAAIATTATDGFLYIPGCAGTPTGTPTAKTGRVPLVVDTTNNKLYFYSGGAWVAAN